MDLRNLTRRLVALCFLIIPFVGNAQQPSYCGDAKFENKVSSVLNFSVPIVSVTELDAMKDEPNLYIFDAREKDEYETSHIPGAQYIGYDKPTWEVLDDLPSDAKIVVYCSIGYRSEKLGEDIKKKGYDKVYNLYGSIFEWANSGRSLEDGDGNDTKAVHTYNKKWSQWMTNPDYDKTW